MTSQSFVHMHTGIQIRTKIISSSFFHCGASTQELRENTYRVNEGAEPPPNSNISPFCRAEMVVTCTSEGQYIGQRSIGELPLIKKVTEKTVRRAASDTP